MIIFKKEEIHKYKSLLENDIKHAMEEQRLCVLMKKKIGTLFIPRKLNINEEQQNNIDFATLQNNTIKYNFHNF